MTPQYTLLTSNSVLGSVLEYQFIITAVNVVGRGAPSDLIDVMFHDGSFVFHNTYSNYTIATDVIIKL